jgi:hypothetical protein
MGKYHYEYYLVCGTYVTEVQNAVLTAQYRMRDLTVISYAVYGM